MQYKLDTEKVIWRNIDEEIIVLNLDSGHYYVLNKTGFFIWQRIVRQETLEVITAHLVDRFKISHRSAKEDVVALLRTLQREGLILIDEKNKSTA